MLHVVVSPSRARDGRPVREALRIGAVVLTLVLGGCAAGEAPDPHIATQAPRTPAYNRPYRAGGRWYTPRAEPGYDQIGLASWYGYTGPGRRTADGEPFDIAALSAAHPTLPIPSWLEVTNLDNGRRARVRLNDRGPFGSGRILDVSQATADRLGFRRRGVARVRVRYLGPAEPFAHSSLQWAAASGSRTRYAVSPLDSRPQAGAPQLLAFDPRAEVAADAADQTSSTSGP